jgi:hypothetical protein
MSNKYRNHLVAAAAFEPLLAPARLQISLVAAAAKFDRGVTAARGFATWDAADVFQVRC